MHAKRATDLACDCRYISPLTAVSITGYFAREMLEVAVISGKLEGRVHLHYYKCTSSSVKQQSVILYLCQLVFQGQAIR